MAEIEVEGIRELEMALDGIPSKVADAGIKELSRAGLKIIAEAQRNIERNGTKATSQLFNSGKCERDKSSPIAVTVGFFDAKAGNGYAALVEYGSNKRWHAPLGMLQAWAKVKYHVEDGLAWGIAKKVQTGIWERPGLRAQPFFQPAIEKHKKMIVDALSSAIDKTLNHGVQ